MINRIFNSDDNLIYMEEKKRWYETVEYICDLYEENKEKTISEEIVCLGLFQCWSIFTYLTNSTARYKIFEDMPFYYEKWKHFLLIALDRFLDSPSVCWMAGYTASKHNISFNGVFKPLGEKLMKRGLEIGSLELPFDLVMGKKRRTKNDLYYVMPDLLFPSESEADRYFKELLKEVLPK